MTTVKLVSKSRPTISVPPPSDVARQNLDNEFFAFCDGALLELVRTGPLAFCSELSKSQIEVLRKALAAPGMLMPDQRYLLNCLVALGRAIHDDACPSNKVYDRTLAFVTAFDSYSARRTRSSASASAACEVWG